MASGPKGSPFPIACIRSNLKKVSFLGPSPGSYGVINLRRGWGWIQRHFDSSQNLALRRSPANVFPHKPITAPPLPLVGKVQCTFSGSLQFELHRSCRECRVGYKSVVFALLTDTTSAVWWPHFGLKDVARCFLNWSKFGQGRCISSLSTCIL